MGGPLTGGGGSRFLMSILRNGNVDLSNLRNAPVTLSILGNDYVPCHYLLKAHVAVSILGVKGHHGALVTRQGLEETCDMVIS